MSAIRHVRDASIIRPTHHVSHALALAMAVGLAAPALAQNVHWNTASGIWATPGNWTPAGVPQPFHNVFIGSHANAENATVWHDGFGSQQMANLLITDGMTVRNNMGSFHVAGSTNLTGSNIVSGPFGLLTTYASRMLLEPMKGSSLTTGNLSLSDGARIDMVGQAFAGVNGILSVGANSRVGGIGFFNLNGTGAGPGITLLNDGRLRGLDGAGLTFRQNAGGLFDLDGVSGNGIVDLSAGANSYMRFIGSALADSFSGEIIMSRSSRLDMDLTQGWTADADSTITVLNDNIANTPATIRGGPVTVAGEMNLNSALAVYSSSLTFEPSARVHIDPGFWLGAGHLGFTETTFNGGVFNMGQNASMGFYDHVRMRGGEFIMQPNAAGYKGLLRLYETSAWDGHIIIDGVSQIFGHATIAGPTVVDADTFYMTTFPSTPTVWDINSTFVLNTNALSEIHGNRDHSIINVSNGALGRFTLNLSDPEAAWNMAGQMNLGGLGLFPITRLAGSRMIVEGSLNITGGIVQITADTEFSGAAVDIAHGSTLRMRGRTLVDQATAFLGTGNLRNGIGGIMDLAPGASLSQIGLVNDGLLTIGDGIVGVASVNQFTSTPNAIWELDIGSQLDMVSNDLLLVDTVATLGGVLNVTLADLAPGAIAPRVGDQFIILIAMDGVLGSFTNDPVTVAGALTYEWTVLYAPHTVILRLDSIVPAPGSVALLACSGLIACRRRRV
ncbi:MAG: hypothetical protein KF912_00815 [Phycisphaeraceae bacterium]|nr:hypothetical protein [Phycisphaeraceae bacterium]